VSGESVFELDEAITILERTPVVLNSLLGGLPGEWTGFQEAPNTFSPFDVVGHLIQGEIHDWMPRVHHILYGNPAVAFQPFDRFAMREADMGRTVDELLEEFAQRRVFNLEELLGLGLSATELYRSGTHPELGTVKLSELLAAWVVHDLSHIGQVARVMARRYGNEVGPWVSYLPILGSV